MNESDLQKLLCNLSGAEMPTEVAERLNHTISVTAATPNLGLATQKPTTLISKIWLSGVAASVVSLTTLGVSQLVSPVVSNSLVADVASTTQPSELNSLKDSSAQSNLRNAAKKHLDARGRKIGSKLKTNLNNRAAPEASRDLNTGFSAKNVLSDSKSFGAQVLTNKTDCTSAPTTPPPTAAATTEPGTEPTPAVTDTKEVAVKKVERDYYVRVSAGKKFVFVKIYECGTDQLVSVERLTKVR